MLHISYQHDIIWETSHKSWRENCSLNWLLFIDTQPLTILLLLFNTLSLTLAPKHTCVTGHTSNKTLIAANFFISKSQELKLSLNITEIQVWLFKTTPNIFDGQYHKKFKYLPPANTSTFLMDAIVAQVCQGQGQSTQHRWQH